MDDYDDGSDESDYNLIDSDLDQKIFNNDDDDDTALATKSNHENYPIWVNTKREIVLYVYSKRAKFAQALLTAIAEPMTRNAHMHIYALTKPSLYAAVSSGITAQIIIEQLTKYSKTVLPQSFIDFVDECTSKYGKASLVLRKGKMKIETSDIAHLRYLLKHRRISDCLIKGERGEHGEEPKPLISRDCEVVEHCKLINEHHSEQPKLDQDIEDFYTNIDKMVEGDDGQTDPTLLKDGKIPYSVEIESSMIEIVQKECKELGANLLVEYDFHSDKESKNIEGHLRSHTNLRPYQAKSLGAMFAKNRARSGIVVLPCGAGKTLVGVTAAMSVGKKCIIFCSGAVAVDQWRDTVLKHTTVESKQIARFTGKIKDTVKNQDIMITTYNIIGYDKKRSSNSGEIMKWVQAQDWGLSILDEVHTAAAKTFRKVLTIVKSHCQLGLTATLVREDDKISDLHFLIGPKLYEANWMDLQDQGFIARIQCVVVKCPMSTEFCQEYFRASENKRTLLYIMNPEKIRRCQFLMNYHEARNDKILIFLDCIYAIRIYSEILNRRFIDGSTSHEDRTAAMNEFKSSKNGYTLIVSRIADVALDLPEASVLIQAGFQGASRRQEAQRLGRITRAKQNMNPDVINGYFYSLITPFTVEEAFGKKRQQFLKDQGYVYKVVSEFEQINYKQLAFFSSDDRKELLRKVLSASDKDAEIESKNKKKLKSKTQTAKEKHAARIAEMKMMKKNMYCG